MNVLIAVPTMRGEIKVRCASSIFAIQRELRARGASCEFQSVDSAEVVIARNMLSSIVAHRADLTHLLFVDSDMNVGHRTVLRMVDEAKDVIGCVYPKRQLNMTKALQAARTEEPGRALALASDFIVRALPAGLTFTGGIGRVAGVGMGVCLIARNALLKLIATAKIREDRSHFAKMTGYESMYGFFDPIIDGPNHMTEDMSFCERYRNLCGGEIWALSSEPIGHIGEFEYTARLSDLQS